MSRRASAAAAKRHDGEGPGLQVAEINAFLQSRASAPESQARRRGIVCRPNFPRMTGMNRPTLVLSVLLWVCGSLPAQDTQVSVVKLEGAAYPHMALAARVFGEVILSVALAPDGSARSVTVESGPPMLRQAAIESAKRSQFQATLGNRAGQYRVVYRFVLDQTTECEHDDSYPRATHEGNVVTVIEQNVPICDPGAAVVHFRSVKCLYLWKCGSRM